MVLLFQVIKWTQSFGITLRMKEIEEGRGRVSKGGTTNLCKRKKKSRNKKV